jgi:hypothetical protein
MRNSTPFFVIRLPLTSRTKYCVLLFDFSKTFLLVRVSSRMLGHLGLFSRCTLSHSPCHSVCMFGRYHNSFSRPRVSSLVKICFFPRFFVFWRIFFPSFLVRVGILSSCPLSDVYCCTYREDVRNRFHSVRVRWISFVKFQILFVINY